MALRLNPNKKNKRVDFEIINNAKANQVGDVTVLRGSATCPVCGYSTPVKSVRKQLTVKHGGANEAQMIVVVTTLRGRSGRIYRLPTEYDLLAIKKASNKLDKMKNEHKGILSLVPNEPTPLGGGSGAGRAFSQRNYGMDIFEDFFTSRQALALTTLVT